MQHEFGGADYWAKFGAWGGGMIFDPATGAYIAGTQNGRHRPKKYWSTQIVSALREARK
jgi:hypothetical protein